MIIAKCPLRISLAGGSTDLQSFIDTNGYGAVVSFPCSLYSYISIHKNNRNKYIINYSIREEEEKIENIKNDIAREVLKYFPCEPITMTFNTDAHSSGTGLASSSAYTIASIAAISKFVGKNLSNFEICRIALEVERKFNIHTGYQDPYGCGIGSLKKMVFIKGKDPQITYLDNDFFEQFELKLFYTGVSRESSTILKKVLQDDKKCFLENVDNIEKFILNKDYHSINKLINLGWQQKKNNSSHILNENINKIEKMFEQEKQILAYRLCGAGNGGYFFLVTNKNFYLENSLTISVDNFGVQTYEI